VLKRFEDGSVRFRHMTLYKFRYYSRSRRESCWNWCDAISGILRVPS